MGTNLQNNFDSSLRKRIAGAVFRSTTSESTLIKDGPHIGSEFTPPRLFGGQMLAQAYSACRQLLPTETFSGFSFKFLVAGNCSSPITYSLQKCDSLLRVNAVQDKKTLGTGILRLKDDKDEYLPLISSSELPSIPDPDKLIDDQQFLKSFGAGREIDMDKLLSGTLFEIFPVEMTDKRMILWTRIHPEIRDYVQSEDRVDVCLMFTDFFVYQVVADHLSKYRMSLAGGSSLSHSVHLHTDPREIDVYGYHLFEVNFECFSWNRALLRATLYDRRLKPIMSVHQESYILAKPRKSSSKL